MADRNLPIWLRAIDEGPGRAEMERGGGGSPDSLPGGLTPFQSVYGQQSPSDTNIAQTQFNALIAALWKQTNIFMLPFTAGLAPILLRPAENRKYLFIQNQSAANIIGVSFGNEPGPVASAPAAALLIPINLGFYEPIAVPQGEVWVNAAANGTPGILLYSA